jgi:ribosomal protein S18 acetylase RimI-like enzyme
MGLRKVFLTTEFSNHQAVSFFRKFGFDIKSTYGDECEMRARPAC